MTPATDSPKPVRRGAGRAGPLPSPAAPGRDARLPLMLPLALAAALASLSLLPSVRSQAVLAGSILGAAGFLTVWTGLFWYVARPGSRRLGLEIVLRQQHYLQACAQLSVYLYWGWYWRQVYDSAHLIAAQILFAYGFDMLLGWTRRGTYTLGFGPFPIIFSINLFLWFKPDWFYWQFAMVAVGFLAKEFIRWEKNGSRVHVFNPSSFPLGLFSLALILTGNTAVTWGQEIAQTFEWPPHIRLWIFLAGLPGQYLFGVTSMTMSAVVSVVAFGLGYHAIFGTYYFVDGFMPAAVFLGMHLLFTDPSTSPRTELGRILFGVIYGLGVVALFGVLGALGAPTFYDKLMAVPLMNMTIQLIDAAVRSPWLRRLDPARLGSALAPRRRNLVWIAIWALVFVFVSDPTSSYRPRRWLPLWDQACAADKRNGCSVLSRLEAQYCRQGSGWACNELGVLMASGRAARIMPAQEAFDRACALGVAAGCSNRRAASAVAGSGTVAAEGTRAGAGPEGGARSGGFLRSTPQPADYPLLLQEGRGPLAALSPNELYAEACRQGWADGCQRLATTRSGGATTPSNR